MGTPYLIFQFGSRLLFIKICGAAPDFLLILLSKMVNKVTEFFMEDKVCNVIQRGI
jgi:hypothetical protein